MNGQTIEVIISDFQFRPLQPERVDLNRDGVSDIVLQNTASTWVGGWLLDRAGQPNAFVPVYFSGVGAWRVVGTGDVNSDGIGDIILQNATSSWVGAWLMRADGEVTSFVPVYFSDLGAWRVVALTDVSHDGVTDLILQDAATGYVGAVLMDGTGQPTSFLQIYFSPVGGWRVVTAADLNGDGVGDLILQDEHTSWVGAWIMSPNGNVLSFVPVYFAGIGAWAVVGTADVNDDGVADLVLQNSASTWVGAWIMNGAGQATSFFPLYFAATGPWRVNGRN